VGIDAAARTVQSHNLWHRREEAKEEKDEEGGGGEEEERRSEGEGGEGRLTVREREGDRSAAVGH